MGPMLVSTGLRAWTLAAGVLFAGGDEGFGGAETPAADEGSSCTVQDAQGRWVSCDALLEREQPAPPPVTAPVDEVEEGAEKEPPPPPDIRRFRKEKEVGGPWSDAFKRVKTDEPEVPLIAVRREARERDLDARQARADKKAGLLDDELLKRHEQAAAVSARVRELTEVLALRRRERCLARSGKIELIEKMRLPRRVDLTLAHRAVQRQMALKDPPECKRVEFVTSEDVELMAQLQELEARLAQPGGFASQDAKKEAEEALEALSEEVRGVIRRDPTRLETKAAKPEKIRRWGPTEVKQLNRRLREQAGRDSD